MPFRDGTGPFGTGTPGRGLGPCGRGGGAGWWPGRRGFGRFGCWGWGRGAAFWGQPVSAEEERAALERESSWLRSALEGINRRLSELGKTKSE